MRELIASNVRHDIIACQNTARVCTVIGDNKDFQLHMDFKSYCNNCSANCCIY